MENTFGKGRVMMYIVPSDNLVLVFTQKRPRAHWQLTIEDYDSLCSRIGVSYRQANYHVTISDGSDIRTLSYGRVYAVRGHQFELQTRRFKRFEALAKQRRVDRLMSNPRKGEPQLDDGWRDLFMGDESTNRSVVVGRKTIAVVPLDREHEE